MTKLVMLGAVLIGADDEHSVQRRTHVHVHEYQLDQAATVLELKRCDTVYSSKEEEKRNKKRIKRRSKHVEDP